MFAAGMTAVAVGAAELTNEQKAAVAVAERALASSVGRAQSFTVQSVEPRQWSDSSLGCRKPGMSYLQVITEGYAVKLEGQGQIHQVHVAGENAVICTADVAVGVARMPASRVTDLPAMEQKAIADLAQRLNANAADIRVTSRVPQSWNDSALGCSGAVAATQPAKRVAGFKLSLRHGERVYTYHTDMVRVMACPPIEAK
jgi:hypothetical protein